MSIASVLSFAGAMPGMGSMTTPSRVRFIEFSTVGAAAAPLGAATTHIVAECATPCVFWRARAEMAPAREYDPGRFWDCRRSGGPAGPRADGPDPAGFRGDAR